LYHVEKANAEVVILLVGRKIGKRLVVDGEELPKKIRDEIGCRAAKGPSSKNTSLLTLPKIPSL
jgi:hypothetical protein